MAGGGTISNPRQCCAFDEYQVGQVSSLKTLHGSDDLPRDEVVNVRIRKLHTRTMSCTILVEIVDDSSAQLCGVSFLKLFDRLFADVLRDNEGIEPWSKEKEQAYIASVDSEEIYNFLHKLLSVHNFQRDTEETWDGGEKEAFLAYKLVKMWEAETAAYDALQEHQGRVIPKLLATVDLEVVPPNIDQLYKGRDNFTPFHVKGILLEHLIGCNLFDIVHHFPRSTWQGIVDQAIALVRLLDDKGIFNSDGTPMNFIVSKAVDASEEQQFQVYMIDFGMCRFRPLDESLTEWNRRKADMDEEDAVVVRMRRAMEEQGFDLHLEESRLRKKYNRWADRDDSGNTRLVKLEVRPGKFLWILPSPSE